LASTTRSTRTNSRRRDELYEELVAIRAGDPKGTFHHSDVDLCMLVRDGVAPKALNPGPTQRRTPVVRTPRA
jgi:hypothetical protein